jgi:hypothetical protein
MLNALRKLENDMPRLLKGKWISCGTSSVHCVVDDWVLELHKIDKIQSWDWMNNFAVKIISGMCELHISHGQHWSKVIGETGFEYEIISGEHSLRIQPLDDSVLAIVVLPKADKKYMNLGKISSFIVGEFVPFYESETTQQAAPSQDFKWRIGHEDGCVVTDFSQTISWMALKPEEAEEAARSLLHHARKARGF